MSNNNKNKNAEGLKECYNAEVASSDLTSHRVPFSLKQIEAEIFLIFNYSRFG